MNNRWEYKILKPDAKGVGFSLSTQKYLSVFETQINKLGLEGWECFAVDHGVYYFKRLK